MPNYKSKFNKKWLKIYPWVREVDDDVYKAYCTLCKCEIKVDTRGIGSVRQHKDAAKHKSKAFSAPSDTSGVPARDVAMKDDSDFSAASNQQKADDFETYWCDGETETETNTHSPLQLNQDQKPILHTNHSVSIPKISNPNQPTERTLSVQRMKMFEAELRVWQRKGEAIVKLMETVGHDKEMWEIINKQSKLHERERERICEQYDV